MPVKLITHAKWISQTKRKIARGRSQLLQNVDIWIQAYENDPKPNNLEMLKTNLDSWVATKMKNGVLKTKRDHKGEVSRLIDKCTAALELRDPVKSPFSGIWIGNDLYRGNHWVPKGFKTTVRNRLRTIYSKTTGKQLIDSITAAYKAGKGKKRRKRVVIEYSGTGSSAAPLDSITNEERKKIQKTGLSAPSIDVQELLSNTRLLSKKDKKSGLWTPGKGTSAVVTWNHLDPANRQRPDSIGLAHELVHAYHYVNGLCRRLPTNFVTHLKDFGIMEEEMRTVGFGGYAGEVPSENSIRGEHKLKVRKSYSKTMSFKNVTVTT